MTKKKKIAGVLLLLFVAFEIWIVADYESESKAPTPTPTTTVRAAPKDEKPIFVLTYTPDSTCFRKVGYDDGMEILMVYFRTSGEYWYYDFPPEMYEKFLNADSLGGFYNEYIKGEYPSLKISEEEAGSVWDKYLQ